MDSSFDEVSDLAIQRDGTIVLVGHDDSSFALARYTRLGRLDRSFGKAGRVVTDVGGDGYAQAVAVQADGKIVVAGEGEANGFTIVRYTQRGLLDSTFGRGGVAEFDFSDECGGWVRAVAIQPDGMIVAGGMCSGDTDAFVVARYTSDGRLDQTFGAGGYLLTDFGPEWFEAARAVAIQGDGRIIVAGEAERVSPRDVEFALVRYMPDGRLDASFGSGGKVLGGPGGAAAIALQADGKIVAAGGGTVVRFNPDGSHDRSFDARGLPSSLGGTGLAIQSDGMIVTCWTTGPTGGYKGPRGIYDFAVTRLTSEGALDGSFGTDGKARTDIGPKSDDSTSAVAVQDDGKIVVAGDSEPQSGPSASTDFAVVRYTSNGQLDRGFGRGGKTLTDFGFHVTSLSATRTKTGVLVRWRTDFEIRALGFEVYTVTNGRRVRVDTKAIAGKGKAGRGASYSFLVRRAPKAARRFWLREITVDNFYGPAIVK